MKIINFILVFIFLINVASAASPYASADVYYNDKLLPGKEIAKPSLKIGEPFSVKIVMTLNQTSRLFVEVCSIGNEMPFEVIEGPSSFSDKKHFKSLEPGTYTFEWTLKPTEEWGDWSMPVNFWYQIHEVDDDDALLRGKFTIAYPYISNEHYEGKGPSSATPPSESLPSSNSTSSESTPAFTLLAAVFALALVSFRR